MDKSTSSSSTSETTGHATADLLKDGETKESEKSEEVNNGDSELDKENKIYDSGKNLDLSSPPEGGINHDDHDADMNLESISQGELMTDQIEQVDQVEKTHEEQNIMSKVEEERMQTTEENCADSSGHDVLGDTTSIGDIDSKSKLRLSSNDVELVDECSKMSEEHNVESKVEEEKTQAIGESCGDSIKQDETSEINSSIDLHSKSQQELSSTDSEQVEQGQNMDEKQSFQSTTRENSGDSIKEDTSNSSTVLNSKSQQGLMSNDIEQVEHIEKIDDESNFKSKQTATENDTKKNTDQENQINVPVVETKRCISFSSLKADIETEEPVRPEKAKSLRNLVKSKSIVAVTNFLRAVSGKFNQEEERKASDSTNDKEAKKVPPKPGDKSAWNPLSFIIRDNEAKNKSQNNMEPEAPEPINVKGRIILYTKLGCQSCNEVRLFLYNKRLRYVEINIDVYPSRKLELEKFTGSCIVPKVFFNEVVIGGLNELKSLDEAGKLDEKIDFLVNEEPAFEAPLPPLSGEDDTSSHGHVDELALIVRKMKESIVIKDRFYKMRRFSRCFLGSDAVSFLSQDQLLEEEEAVEFGRKLASKLFFQHVLQENLFEDGSHVYWFLDDIPVVSSQCHNIPRGIIEIKPKPIRDIASRLRFLSGAIYEAYLSEDGKHVDYRTIHGSEEFARYLRIIQELQRVEFQNMPREEKLAFFINLYNMMTIHAILVLGHPSGPTERRKVLGDFKYVMGGYCYSLSDIQNGILRCNQRLPFTLTKPFGANDKRVQICLPYPEPLIHFALVLGTRSGPQLRCYSPGNIDEELMDSARSFLRGGGLVVDHDAKIAHLTKLLKWFNVDFGKTEVEVLKHASNYLEPANSEALLELLANDELKVIYQHYDWGLNL